LKLYRILNGLYEITEEAITKFKRSIKNELQATLNMAVEDFSIYNHITGGVVYDYVDSAHNSSAELLPLLDRKSHVFTRISDTAILGYYCSKFVFCKTATLEEDRRWRAVTTPHFNVMPTLLNSNSDEKITLMHFEILKASDIVL
jgi:hypothetical protein